MSELSRAVDAEIEAFRPERTPPFSALADRRRSVTRRRTGLTVAAAAGVALLAVPVAWWAASGGDQLVQEAGPAGGPAAAFSVHQVLEAAPQDAATGSVQAPSPDGAAAFPDGYACGPPASTPASDGLVACTVDGLGEAEILRLAPSALTSSAVRDASAEPSMAGGAWEVVVVLTPEGARVFEELTGTAACAPVEDAGRRIALVVDGAVVGVPLVSQSVVCGEGIQTGSVQLVLPDVTEAEAQDLARRLTPSRSG